MTPPPFGHPLKRGKARDDGVGRTAPQSIDPMGFLPIDPKLPACLRGDDMGRKVGMTWPLKPAGQWE